MHLSQREKIMVSTGGVCLTLFLFFSFFLLPLMDERSNLIRRVEKQAQQLGEMQQMQVDMQSLSVQNASLQTLLDKRPKGFSLFSFLEMHAAASQLKDHIVYMKPSTVRSDTFVRQSQVEMKLQGIDLKRLVFFLEQVESPDNLVGVKRLSIQQNSKESGALDVIMQIVCIDAMAAKES